MTTTVAIATVPSADTPGTCIHVHHEKRSYLFGRVAEGTQRAFGSRSISLSSVENVFLSGAVGWEQLGGLFGFLLSIGATVDAAKEHRINENLERRQKGKKLLKDMTHLGVGVHGADNLCHIIAACRPIIFRQPIRVQTHEFREDPRNADPSNLKPDWEDDYMQVWTIPVTRALASSPPKRCHDEISNGNVNVHDAPSESPQKRRSSVSEPDVASMIVERIMFNGSLNNRSVLAAKKLCDLTPTDLAIVRQDGSLRAYKGPYASDGIALANPDDTAWVFPELGDNTGDIVGEGNSERILAINHCALPQTAYGETSLSYIVKCQERRGKFNVVSAKELGVKVQDYKLLTAGQSVQGKDGMTVTPEMVLGESTPGRGIIVADIATPDLVDAFMERPEWKTPELMQHISIMYWILGPELASDSRIQHFTQQRPQIKHVFCAPDTCPNMISHPGAAQVQTKLRRIDPERFPLLQYDNRVQIPAPPPDSAIELGRAGTRLQLMPRLVFDDQAPAPFPDLLTAAKSVGPDLIALADAAREEASQPALLARIEETEKDIPNRDAEIICLGTGSSVPNQHRNVSATLIRVPGIGNYLLDCGEGTLGQILRAMGAEEAANVLRDLRCIVISHVHADHHLGAVSLIKAWYEQSLRDGRSTATLAISCIGRYRDMLQELSQVEDIGFHRLRFPSCPEVKQNERDVTTAEDLGEENFGLAGIKRIAVPHCWRSYATELELTSGLRIAYSGDCRPSSEFAQACRGAHLLVHECTFDDDKQSHAKAKRHSTMSEALGVAREMGARRTLLTHFSQRYSKADSLRRGATAEGEEQSVMLAFDMMRLRLGDFQTAACYIPVVQKLMETIT